MDYDHVLCRLERLKKTTKGYTAKCPAHNPDTTPSLRLAIGDNGNLLAWCGAGCSFTKIVDALGLKLRDFCMAERTLIRTHQYIGVDGKVIFEKLRYEPKSFQCRRPNPGFDATKPESDANQRYIYNLDGVTPILYNFNAILDAAEAAPERFVWLCEGESKVDYLTGLGLLSTSSPFGAGKWAPHFTNNLQGKNVILVPDEDAPGLKHARMVAKEIVGNVKKLVVVRIPKPHKQIDEWLQTLDKDARRKAITDLAIEHESKDPLEVLGSDFDPATIMFTVHKVLTNQAFSQEDLKSTIEYLETKRG